MKVSEAIARANEMRPNAIDDQYKAEWLFELDGDMCELMSMEIPPENKYPDEDQDLLMPYPHDNMYVYYLMSKIDLMNEETNLYANDAALANQAMGDARRWWMRTHDAKKQRPIGVM